MKRKFMAFLACLLSMVFVLSLAACGATVTMSETSATIGVGDTLRLKAEASDGSKIESWTTSDETIATVSNGTVRGIKTGKATITAKAEGGASATCEVTVEDIKVTLNKTSTKIERFETEKLTATISNGETEVTWASSDATIASVDKDGVVTANKEGTAVITARRTKGTASATCEVEVVWSAKPQGYAEVGHFEQNKVPLNTWGRWANQNWEGGGTFNINSAEYQDQDGSEAGKVTFDYEAAAHGTLGGADFQVVYRSAGEGGKLKTGVYYSVTLDITSTSAGVVTLNGTDFTLEANKKTTITSYFLHADDGTIYPEGNYDNIYYTAIFLLLGKLETGVVTVENIKWEEITTETLATPGFSISGKTITVTDTNTAGVGSYTVGFFARAESATPKYTVTVDTSKTAAIDDSLWINGTYYAKIKANGTDVRYGESAWSEAQEYTVAHASIEYALENSTEADLGNDVWGFWAEDESWVTANYKDDVITVTISEAATGRKWHAIQLFHKNTAFESGKTYTVYFTLNSTAEGIVRFGNQNHNIVAGDNELSYTVSGGGTTFSLAFAQPDESNWDSALSTVEGTFVFKGFDWEEVAGSTPSTPSSQDPGDYELGEEILPGSTEIIFSGENDEGAKEDTWMGWYVQDTSWNCGDIVTMQSSNASGFDLADGVISFGYTGGSVNYSVQLFYKNPAIEAGAQYFVFATVELSGDLTVGLNGKSMDLKAGKTEIYSLFNSGSALSMQFAGVKEGSITVKVSGVKWQKVLNGAPAPEDKDPVGTEYRAEYGVLTNGGEDDAKPDEWTYWYDQSWVGSAVTMTKNEIADGKITLAFEGNTDSAAWFGVQLFYKNSKMFVGSKYTLSFKLTVDKACKVTINGQVKELTAGENTVTVDITLTSATCFTLQFGVHGDGDIGGFVGNLEATISDVVWTKAE